jgi:hypothetical protein
MRQAKFRTRQPGPARALLDAVLWLMVDLICIFREEQRRRYVQHGVFGTDLSHSGDARHLTWHDLPNDRAERLVVRAMIGSSPFVVRSVR